MHTIFIERSKYYLRRRMCASVSVCLSYLCLYVPVTAKTEKLPSIEFMACEPACLLVTGIGFAQRTWKKYLKNQHDRTAAYLL